MRDRDGKRPASLTVDRIDRVPQHLEGAVVAIGNFDGMHRGHRRLLEVAVEEARRLDVAAVVLTFEPHPRSVLKPEQPVFRLTPVAAKARLLAALGLDGLVVAPFDREFAGQHADSFIEDVLVGRLAPAAVVIGHDFHFGRGRSGSPEVLRAAGQRFGFSVRIIEAVLADDGTQYSASSVRLALEAGDIARANALLGYRWFVIGTVVAGDRRGRELGYPTANIRLSADCALKHGIYAVRVSRPDGTVHDAVASFGRRPTFDNGEPLLESFLFDFSGDLYGEELTVSFLGWIRGEERFDSADALVEAMDRDSAGARAILAEAGRGNALDRAVSGA